MLFNKDNNGSEELQEITGYYAAANQFSVIQSEVVDATRVVAGLVGTGVVEAADSAYQSDTDADFVAAVRTPIAILAVARYSRGNLVSHEDSGSKVKVDGNEKMPWEWMLDRDERAQQERWYRALDALYAYLDDKKPDSWQNSPAKSRIKDSIVKTIEDLEAVYPVDGSYYVYYMLQGLIIESQALLHKMMGDSKWSAITADPVAEGDKELLRVCQRWAILSALVKAVRRWSLEVFPLSIARRFCPSYNGGRSSCAATLEEMGAYVSGLEGQIAEARGELAELLADGLNPWRNYDPQPRNDPKNKFFTAQ